MGGGCWLSTVARARPFPIVFSKELYQEVPVPNKIFVVDIIYTKLDSIFDN